MLLETVGDSSSRVYICIENLSVPLKRTDCAIILGLYIESLMYLLTS